jgi:hypothetical protein
VTWRRQLRHRRASSLDPLQARHAIRCDRLRCAGGIADDLNRFVAGALLRPPLLVISDGAGAAGLIDAAESSLPRSLRQRCLIHRCRNLLGAMGAPWGRVFRPGNDDWTASEPGLCP